MESPPKSKFTAIFFILISLSFGLISFILCIAAEIKRNKEGDLRWNGKLCYSPTSRAFGLGIAALVCLFFSQIIGNSIVFKNSCSGRKSNSNSKISAAAKVLFLISWLSFGLAVILLIAATSMSRRQNYGVGWLNGECYLVKGGTFAGSAILVLVTVGSVNGSAFSTIKCMFVSWLEEERSPFASLARVPMHNIRRFSKGKNLSVAGTELCNATV